jgi:hypothetical protein
VFTCLYLCFFSFDPTSFITHLALQTGNRVPILEETSAAGANVNAVAFTTMGLFRDPGVIDIPPVEVTGTHPHLSSIVMLAPSPDWFTGFTNFKPVADGDVWYESFTIDTFPFDAGTDSGVTFMSNDTMTDPQAEVFQITPENTVDGIFLNPEEDAILPTARFVCGIVTPPEPAAQPLEVVEAVASEIPTTEPVQYECTASLAWSGATHPVDYPANAHFSPIVMASHNSDFSLWGNGVLATTGVKTIAEVRYMAVSLKGYA